MYIYPRYIVQYPLHILKNPHRLSIMMPDIYITFKPWLSLSTLGPFQHLEDFHIVCIIFLK